MGSGKHCMASGQVPLCPLGRTSPFPALPNTAAPPSPCAPLVETQPLPHAVSASSVLGLSEVFNFPSSSFPRTLCSSFFLDTASMPLRLCLRCPSVPLGVMTLMTLQARWSIFWLVEHFVHICVLGLALRISFMSVSPHFP